MVSQKPVTLKCSNCKAEYQIPSRNEISEFYPFCSARCRDVDLASWLDEDNEIKKETDEK